MTQKAGGGRRRESGAHWVIRAEARGWGQEMTRLAARGSFWSAVPFRRLATLLVGGSLSRHGEGHLVLLRVGGEEAMTGAKGGGIALLRLTLLMMCLARRGRLFYWRWCNQRTHFHLLIQQNHIVVQVRINQATAADIGEVEVDPKCLFGVTVFRRGKTQYVTLTGGRNPLDKVLKEVERKRTRKKNRVKGLPHRRKACQCVYSPEANRRGSSEDVRVGQKESAASSDAVDEG